MLTALLAFGKLLDTTPPEAIAAECGNVTGLWRFLGDSFMCIFTQSVELVADTRIFARASKDRQILVYSMRYAAAAELAMVLPLPTPAHSLDDAVRFINLEGYPLFFDDMNLGFPLRERSLRLGRIKGLEDDTLVVHDVGKYEASFVPTLRDFARLDKRFRIPRRVWDKLPAYHDYGFAVFKLRSTVRGGFASLIRRTIGQFIALPVPEPVHPMAFDFPRRQPDLLYFPTIHIHDGKVHAHSAFDHLLYCQADGDMAEHLDGWERSTLQLADIMDLSRTQGVVDSALSCYRRSFKGVFRNIDATVGESGQIPEAIGAGADAR